jgi:hypothetical protein
MNCKQGDLALCVRSRTGRCVGRTFTCLSLVPEWELEANFVRKIWWPVWAVDSSIMWQSKRFNWVPDSFLMPINPRDDDQVQAESLESTSGAVKP